MKLLQLNLKNFKGIKKFSLDTQGENVSLYGDNGTGKTTIFDAFLWLLFDKDSQNKKDFDIKTLDAENNPIHGLDHEVEGVFQIGTKKLTLRKVYSEKWTKKRGSATAEFTGHTTDHFIDGVPVKKNEFDAKVAEIADESIFRLLTDPRYFNNVLHWEKRRQILLEVCGDISDADVIASDKALAKLPEILDGRSLEDHRKVIAAKRTEINRELERIPVRIDEVENGLPDISGIDEKALPKMIADLKAKRQAKEQELARVESGGEVAEKTKHLREVEARMQEVKNEHQAKIEEQLSGKRSELRKLQEQLDGNDRVIKVKHSDIAMNNSRIESLEKKAQRLRDSWHEVNSREFQFEQDEVCPTCGQTLPAEKLQEARDKALADFNLKKAMELEDITSEGKAIKAEIEELKHQNKAMESAVAQLGKETAFLQEEAEKLQVEIDNAKLYENATPVRLAKLANEIKDIESEISNLKAGTREQKEAIQAEIYEIDNELEALHSQRARLEARKNGLQRIEQLKDQERELAAEYERLEKELYLTEQFIRTKVQLLEEKINSRFQYARFKLFNVLVNGGVEECCETLYQGVPYSSALNNAARINVGLDIINTLSDHYGFSAPIFIDNREAVTQLISTKAQVISLVVSEKDKKLRVEVEEPKKLKEAV